MAVNVKIPRVKMIAAMQEALDAERKKLDSRDPEVIKRLDEQNAAQERKYTDALNAWGKKVARLVAAGTVSVVNVSNYRGDSHITFSTVGLDLPAQPVRKPRTAAAVYQDNYKIRELENAVKLLSLSEEEFVNTSTYKSVAQYL